MPLDLSNEDLLARLVAFDTVSDRSNVPMVDFVCDYLDLPGVETCRCDGPGPGKVNLVVRVGPGAADRAGLILSGHMDVVPADEPAWKSDPFTLTDCGDAYVARGACDMKGFVAIAVNAARTAAARGLVHPLVLILTCDEELGTLGAQHLAATWDRRFPLPKSALIGEPTSLRVVRMHKGHMTVRITLSGRAAHSGYPSQGRSAVEPAARVIAALARLRGALEGEGGPHAALFPETPFPALCVARVRGGTAINIIPDRCVIDVGVRAMPGMASGPLFARIEDAVHAVRDVGEVAVELVNDSPPLLTDETTPIHRTLCAIVAQTQSFGVSYASDAGPLQALDIDCALCGPGTIEVAHKPNESLPKREFRAAADIVDRAVHGFCMAP
ncbi:MAG: acetylornithine deacetylase [Phycisphaerae bacterium]